MKFTNEWGEEYNLTFKETTYANNGTLAVLAITDEGEPYATVTVNIQDSDRIQEKDVAYLDTNNVRSLVKAMEDAGYIEMTYLYGMSGFCTYPQARFTEKFFKEVAA